MNNKSKKTNREKIIKLTELAMLMAIEIIVCFTPLGTLPALGPLSATLSHVPVIITAAILGPGAGAFMGLVFGACSFIYWTFTAPGLFSFIYTPFYTMGEFSGNFGSLLICFVPRILIGVVTGLIIKALGEKIKYKSVTYTIAGLLGSLTNTFLVLGGIYVFFGQEYLTALGGGAGKTLIAILGMTVLTNGLPEAAIGALACSAVGLPVKNAVAKLHK